MYRRFGLTLMVNHACNLRCTYCYTGAKFQRAMDPGTGTKGIDRALASLVPGGTLDLGFFGGEPLIEAPLIASLIAHARREAREMGRGLALTLTTNGTQSGDPAWSIMTGPDMDLAVSHDGLSAIHDRHRPFADGRSSAAVVLGTIRKLVRAGRDFRVVMVVRPSNCDSLADGIAFLRDAGVRRFDLSLDLWTSWSKDAARRLEKAVATAATAWAAALPDVAINWFDEKAARMAGVAVSESARCGFGRGEIAVAPSGRLYPCERLIGEDLDANPMRLRGTALDGIDFLDMPTAAGRSGDACSVCALESICSTSCRCSNYVRTGRVDQPDGLLCLLDKVCVVETARALEARPDVVSKAWMEVGDESSEARE